MGIGSKLKKLIEEKNTNVNALANRAKVKPSTLYSIIERDNTKVDIELLIAIAKVLGVSVEYFSDSYVNSEAYYLNPETAKLAQAIYDNPDLGFLFDAAKDASPDDLRMAAEILRKLRHNSDQ